MGRTGERSNRASTGRGSAVEARPGRSPIRHLARGVLAGAIALGLIAGPPVAAGKTPPGEPGKVATAVGTGGAAASVDALATEAAIESLRKGGNAVDAAVTAAGVLGVTEPFSSGIGGGGFMVIRTPGGEVTTIDGRETAPAAMQPTSFFESGAPLSFDAARYSGLSAGVPGTVATWDEALDRYGTDSLRRALKPGAKVARKGFQVDQTFFDQTESNVDYFDDVPSTAEIYLDPDGTPRDVGTMLRNRDMARAYKRIAKHGPRGFYGGPIAGAMAAAAQDPPVGEDADHVWRPGLMTEQDIGAYAAPEREPTRVGYRGLDVWGMGPPSSGGSTVGEALNILEGYEPLGADRAQALHRFLEASRYSFADRGAYLADPGYFDVPLSGLLSDSFAAERRSLITDQAADAGPVEAGEPRDNEGDPALVNTTETPGKSTTHLTVSDRHGMVVSYTFTIESIGGNGIVVPGWGFLLNNELTDFDYSDPAHPNAPAGGKRPRSSMAPTIVTRDGEPVLALGSPGGSTIITTVLQILLERFDLAKTLPEAITAPRASQRNGTTTSAEPAFIAAPEARLLQDRHGHAFTRATPDPPAEIGAATAANARLVFALESA
ncbi:MAG: gamma-glutamyltransferase [Solirubrobacterales bacterium]|nr:gamma-glutamyltransferase [Solirubrobacterales bacterium]